MTTKEQDLPTLLKPGYQTKPVYKGAPIEYILNFLSDRTPLSKNGKINVSPKGPGDKIVVIKSDTGSGKSVVMPTYIYNKLFDRTRKNISVLQPRILTAIDIPLTITKYYSKPFGIELDKNIGYSTQAFKRLPVEKGLIFSTIGVLVQQMITMTDEEFMNKYQYIIYDEIHERSVEGDLCLFLLKKLVSNNWSDPACPIIILTSATFDETLFMDYFDTPKSNFIQITGSTFSKSLQPAPYDIANYEQYVINLIKKTHISDMLEAMKEAPDGLLKGPRDIIVFVPGAGQAQALYNAVNEYNYSIASGVENIDNALLNADSKMNELYKVGGGASPYMLPVLLNKFNFEKAGEEYARLFSPIDILKVAIYDEKGDLYKVETPYRRVILATPVAETGITINSLKYCIDTGFYFSVEYIPNFNCFLLANKNVSRGMATQRKGRVGRKAPGIWRPCYTQETFEALPENQLSSILIGDTTETLLGILVKENEVEIMVENSIQNIRDPKYNLFQIHRLSDTSWNYTKNYKSTSVSSLDFIELPAQSMLEHSLEKLHILGFINSNYEVTTLGFYANQIRFISLESRRMILAGYHYGCNILDLITIASFLYVAKHNVFDKKILPNNFMGKRMDASKFNTFIASIGDDFINCIFIWNSFQKYLTSAENITKSILGDRLSKHKNVPYLDNIRQWCLDNGLKYEGFIQVMYMRDQIIENMLNIGMNPYYNSLGIKRGDYNLNDIALDPYMILEEVKKLKGAIYEGFKMNTLKLEDNEYKPLNLRKGPAVKVKSPYVYDLPNMPTYITTSSWILSQKRGKAEFEFVADNFISILSGHISIDETYFRADI